VRTVLLIAHLMAIAVGTGMSFGNYVNLRHAASETGDRAAALGALRRTIGRIGDVVIVLIWASGLALLWAWMAQGGPAPGGWFHAKLAFVVLLTVCHGLARHTSGRMARSGNAALLGRVELFVAGVWISALASIVLAVLAFS
jgi:protoporphyrinogen IX oxidase